MKQYFKTSVLDLDGYSSPPQKEFKVKLNQNESPFDVPEEIKNRCIQRIEQLAWNRYPINNSQLLRDKLAARHAVSADQILLGNGSNQLFQTLLTAVLSPGDGVLLTPPTFSLYQLFAKIYDASIIEVMHPPDESYPLDKVLEKIKHESPRLVIVCSPNNPTGAEISLPDVENICRNAPGLVLFDEAYGEFSDREAVSLVQRHENLVVSRTFSKAFSMAGLRFGYLIAQRPVIQQLGKVNLPYNVNVFTEQVAMELLNHQSDLMQHVQYLQTERDRVYALLQRLSTVTVYPSAANYLLLKGPDDLDLFEALKKHGILVRDVGSYPLLQGHQRVTIGCKEENDLFLDALQRVMQEYHSY
ncbi:MAG: histidinol-phosphate transaminase [candidate division KSB1 bacterium]|nr:histidinol-phosphate transaminase [candidate division KSB1 bacterium]